MDSQKLEKTLATIEERRINMPWRNDKNDLTTKLRREYYADRWFCVKEIDR